MSFNLDSLMGRLQNLIATKTCEDQISKIPVESLIEFTNLLDFLNLNKSGAADLQEIGNPLIVDWTLGYERVSIYVEFAHSASARCKASSKLRCF